MLNNLDTVLAVYFSADPARGDPPLPADLVSRGIGRLLCRARHAGQALAYVLF
jgi:hypothetical protein